MLYDEMRKVLNSGFLRRDEVIRTGVSFVFDAYLVDIGEPEGNSEPIAALSDQENCCKIVKEIGKMHRQENSLAFNKSVLKGLCVILLNIVLFGGYLISYSLFFVSYANL